MRRRTFLIGSAGMSVVALAACTTPQPTPVPSVTPTLAPTVVPRPRAMRRSAWSKDPFARGSFSFSAVGSTPQDRTTLATPVGDRVFFAGEATSADMPGTVAGARASGGRAAAEVMAVAAPGERITIIGAGIAGITAARLVKDAGFDVVVIEARGRVGGRISTVTDSTWPFPIELGPAFIDGSAESRQELSKLGITTLPVPAVTEIRAPSGEVVDEPRTGDEALATALAWAEKAPQDVSVTEALAGSGAADLSNTPGDTGLSDQDWLQYAVATDLEDRFGAGTDGLSAWYASRDPADPDSRIVLGGYSTLVREAAADLDLLANSAVVRVAYTGKGVSLRLETGESLGTDRVIVTVPLGVLKTDALEFAPPLPFDHRGAIAALGMGVLERVWLRFDEPFWDSNAAFWSVVGGESGFERWVNLEPLTGQPVLMGVVAADDATRLADLSDGDFMTAALQSLEPFVVPPVQPVP